MFVKSVFDRLMSFFGLFFIWPILLIVALFIKIKMPNGSVFFTQKRVGQYGQLFLMIKFRTMNVSHSGSSISIAGESRITPLGSVLRRCKLDELPGLYNVLKGEMSFVGPRPDVPGYADKLVGTDRDMLKLKPGITGPASLKYRNEEEILVTVEDPIKYNDEIIFPDKVKINLCYLRNRSFSKDIRIIIYTLLSKDLKDYYN